MQCPTDVVVPTAHGPPAAVSRELTRRERDVLAFMIDRAAPFDPDESDSGVEDTDRTRWREQLRTARAGRPCGCGSCPSIELTAGAAAGPERTSRVVLGAESDEALLLLFIDDDRLSYLELAPTGDRTFAEFPDPTDIHDV